MKTTLPEASATRMANPGDSAPSPAPLPGDVCPPWCRGEHDESRFREDTGQPVHPEDAGVFHYSPVVDSWCPMNGDQPDDESTVVRIGTFLHDDGTTYPVQVKAENVSPGCMGGVDLQIADARRLGEALIMACDLAEGVTRA